MAKRSVSIVTCTLVAVGDAAGFTDGGYPAIIQGGSSTQRIDLLEIFMGGQSTSSAIAIMLWSRDSTVAVTNSYGTGQMDNALDVATAALAAPPLTGNTNTTKPQRSATGHLMNLSFNAFGGVVNRVMPPAPFGPNILGNTQPLGESSLSCFTGGAGIIGCDVTYEPY